MQRYDAIEKGIEKGDVQALREAIGSICYTSRDFSSWEFDEDIKYVESKGIKIKDNRLIGSSTITSQKSTFTDDDFADAIFELKENFCDERIEDVKTIGKKLYGSTSQTVHLDTSSASTSSRGTSPNILSHQKEKNIIQKKIIIILVAVAVIALLLLLTKMQNKSTVVDNLGAVMNVGFKTNVII